MGWNGRDLKYAISWHFSKGPCHPKKHPTPSSPVFQPLSSDVDLCCWISLIKADSLCSWRMLEEATELWRCSLYLQEHRRPPVMRPHPACLFIFHQGASAIFPTLSPTWGRPGQEADAWESWFSPEQGACCRRGALVTDPPTRDAWKYEGALIMRLLWPVSATARTPQTRPHNELSVWLLAGCLYILVIPSRPIPRSV